MFLVQLGNQVFSILFNFKVKVLKVTWLMATVLVFAGLEHRMLIGSTTENSRQTDFR